mmetsp:Transcript_3213/g.15044  ORF Transcript_3213/g.15044 Transcript_3213/m.15044 type:complete len:249 (-) Transcript_3213:4752-5498(-)
MVSSSMGIGEVLMVDPFPPGTDHTLVHLVLEDQVDHRDHQDQWAHKGITCLIGDPRHQWVILATTVVRTQVPLKAPHREGQCHPTWVGHLLGPQIKWELCQQLHRARPMVYMECRNRDGCRAFRHKPRKLPLTLHLGLGLDSYLRASIKRDKVPLRCNKRLIPSRVGSIKLDGKATDPRPSTKDRPTSSLRTLTEVLPVPGQNTQAILKEPPGNNHRHPNNRHQQRDLNRRHKPSSKEPHNDPRTGQL